MLNMRMHKKSRLEERVEECADIVKIADLTDKNMKRAAEKKDVLPLGGIFKNNNPVHLEIGCGKGKFACEKAKLFPDINFLAVEKISNVLIEALERAKAENLKNLYFLNCAAEVLPKYFEGGEIEKIYLNFSNPLPKEGYKKQRLTHPRFIEIYKFLLCDGGEVVQKTDDINFFEFSRESFALCGFTEKYINYDYFEVGDGDIETEHEKLFKSRGKKICRAVYVK